MAKISAIPELLGVGFSGNGIDTKGDRGEEGTAGPVASGVGDDTCVTSKLDGVSAGVSSGVGLVGLTEYHCFLRAE